LASFKTLDFYPINEEYFVLQFTRTEKEKPFGMKTSTDREPLYVKYGEWYSPSTEYLKLNIYKNIELSKQKNTKLFVLPFSDLTQGMKAILAESILI
jgi:hypothetical protein